MEKIWPEPSTKLDAPGGARFGADWGGYWPTPTPADEACQDGAVWE